MFTGFFDGTIVSWAGTAIKGTTKAHSDGCHALAARKKEVGLISGGGDGLIILWTVAGGVL